MPETLPGMSSPYTPTSLAFHCNGNSDQRDNHPIVLFPLLFGIAMFGVAGNVILRAAGWGLGGKNTKKKRPMRGSNSQP